MSTPLRKDGVEMLKEFLRRTAERNGAEVGRMIGVDKGRISQYRAGKIPNRLQERTRLAISAALMELEGLGRETLINVPRETPIAMVPRDKDPAIFAGYVLYVATQIAQLAGSMRDDAGRQLALTDGLARVAANQPAPAKEIDPKIYGARIREQRELLRMSPGELASAVGWQSGAEIEQLEAGKYKWSVEDSERGRFASALKTDIADLCEPLSRRAPTRKGAKR